MNKFAERLRETLKSKEISQVQFALKIGFSDTTVNGWCVGAHEPNFDTLMKVCKELNETTDYMLGMTD